MKNLRQGKLGILALCDVDVTPRPPAHTFNFPEWFSYEILELKVPGAFSREVVGGNLSLASAYAKAAQELERQGATAITADCGFTIAYQEAVRNAVRVPVACSAMMYLPMIKLMLPRNGRIGLLTFDSDRLTEQHFAFAGIDPHSVPIAVRGVQGSQLWKNWIGEPVTTDWEDFDREVLDAAGTLIAEFPNISHVLLECAGFPRCAPEIRSRFGRPVYDWVSLCNQLMESADSTGAASSRQASTAIRTA
jgi:hypothetical protein